MQDIVVNNTLGGGVILKKIMSSHQESYIPKRIPKVDHIYIFKGYYTLILTNSLSSYIH